MSIIVLSLPIDPESLNRQMQAMSDLLQGTMLIPNYRLAFLIPAGTTVEIPFLLPKGFVCTRRSPLRFESSVYDPNILIDVYCDERKVNPFPMPLTGPFEVDFGAYYVKRTSVRIVMINNSAQDALITFQVIPHIISEELYERWYKPIIHASYKFMSKLVEEGLKP